MKVIVIDPEQRNVYQTSSTDFAAIIGNIWNVVRFGRQTNISVDDEGLLRGSPLFRIPQYPAPLAGISVVWSFDEEGDQIDTPWTIETVRDLVTFA